jgi:hypothetical protein
VWHSGRASNSKFESGWVQIPPRALLLKSICYMSEENQMVTSAAAGSHNGRYCLMFCTKINGEDSQACIVYMDELRYVPASEVVIYERPNDWPNNKFLATPYPKQEKKDNEVG